MIKFNTLVVNLFAGPGAGKSTTAARVFSELKERGVVAELVTEFAKDLAWEDHSFPLACQPYVFGQQLWKMERLMGRVQVIVTDSPLLLSCVYSAPDTTEHFLHMVRHYHKSQDRIDVKVLRVKPYSPHGRFQSSEEAWELDSRVDEEVGDFNLIIRGDPAGALSVSNAVLNRLGFVLGHGKDS